jgi:hypothetical protein
VRPLRPPVRIVASAEIIKAVVVLVRTLAAINASTTGQRNLTTTTARAGAFLWLTNRNLKQVHLSSPSFLCRQLPVQRTLHPTIHAVKYEGEPTGHHIWPTPQAFALMTLIPVSPEATSALA